MENMLSCPKVTCNTKRITIKKISVNYKDPHYSSRVKVRYSKDGYDRFQPVFEEFMQHHEECWVMFLTRGMRVLGLSCIGVGGSNSTVVDVRIIFQTALTVNASYIMMAHNHPNGELSSSVHDDNLTTKVAEAGKVLDIKLLDHLILNGDGYFSYADEGLLR